MRVRPRFLAEQSLPRDGRYVFAYTVDIDNVGEEVVQLVSRHWIITNGQGGIEEVRGPGVVGETPVLEPGQSFRYTSGCVLPTARGTMHGSYQMKRRDGDVFDAEIAAFVLAAEGSEADAVLN